MSSEAVQPLRINKSTSSPVKALGAGISRALTELSPGEQRRNSPSWNQATKKMVTSRESSPFDSSPYDKKAASPLNFWKANSPSRFNADKTLEQETSPSVVRRRSSIERLKQASRVKNSAMFAREQKNTYDPNSMPVVERPLAAGRPLAGQGQVNAFIDIAQHNAAPRSTPARGHRRGESQSKIPFMNPTQSSPRPATTRDQLPSQSPSRNSPPKSAMSPSGYRTLPRGLERNIGIWEDQDTSMVTPPRASVRKAKSVTFDTAPPEINEYELVTPDPSSIASGSRQGSYETDEDDEPFGYENSYQEEDSFDASLEDTDKTPVVLPEDWHRASPDTANNDLVNPEDDTFAPARSPSRRMGSTGSDGESRPLPPLPGMPSHSRGDSTNGLTNAAERMYNNRQRGLPQPPPGAEVSKADILSLNQSSMTLEDRLRLLNVQNSPRQSSPEELRNDMVAKEAARLQKHGLGLDIDEDASLQDHSALSLDEGFSFPRISRESILRRVKSRNFDDERDLSPEPQSSPAGYDRATLDPDVAIPSREASSNFDEVVDDEVVIKSEEDEDNTVNFYDIPEISNSAVDAYDLEDDYDQREGTVVRHMVEEDDEEVTSVYSPQIPEAATFQSESTTEDDSPPTPRQQTMFAQDAAADLDKSGITLPNMSNLLDEEDFAQGLQSYLSLQSTPPPAVSVMKMTEVQVIETVIVNPIATVETPVKEEELDTPGTPGSVIRRSVSGSSMESLDINQAYVPETVATIKAPGTKFKARPSLTPADMHTMANTRRIVSGETAPMIPEKSPKRLSMSVEPQQFFDVEEEHEETEAAQPVVPKQEKRRETFGLRIDVGEENDLSFGLDKEFERVMEASKVHSHDFHPCSTRITTASQQSDRYGAKQPLSREALANLTSPPKKGYLMRQNTKVVVAKRNFSSDTANSSDSGRPSSSHGEESKSPRKNRRQSHERTKSWTTEPWNSQTRRKSVQKKYSSDVAPPLPGQESVVGALDTVMEDKSLCLEPEEDAERGRLFVKVVGLKGLDMPLPKNEKSLFRLNLDNGLHCVTTAWTNLSHNAPIGQEFELVVLNELEFQLTLQTKLTAPPKPSPPTISSIPQPSSPTKSPTKKSAFSKLWSTPKKRKEAEQREAQETQEAARRAQESRNQSRMSHNRPPTTWDLLHDVVGDDGSFGRAYFCLKNHEEACFGRQLTVDMPLYNEWAMEDTVIANSVKSKNGGLLRRPPYQIGSLALSLLYVPRPAGLSEDDMPKSMNACLREMKEAEEAKARHYEGFLSQQGGDCPFWRRRFFKLQGTTLTAHHEHTRQPRVKIDLNKAAKLIDDKTTLVRGEASPSTATNSTQDSPIKSPRKGGRRKSAFAEEEEGYMFVDSGFRMRFANGECIDFYADSAAEKDQWMVMLSKAVGSKSSSATGGVVGGKARKWCDAILAKEEAEGKSVIMEDMAAGPVIRKQVVAPASAPAPAVTVAAPAPAPMAQNTSSADITPTSSRPSTMESVGTAPSESSVIINNPQPDPSDPRSFLPSQQRPARPQSKDFALSESPSKDMPATPALRKAKHRSMLDFGSPDLPVERPGEGARTAAATHAASHRGSVSSAARPEVRFSPTKSQQAVPRLAPSPEKQSRRQQVRSMIF